MPQSSPYQPFGGWVGPTTWPLGPPQSPTMLVFGVGLGMIALDSTFLWLFHSKCDGFVTLPMYFSSSHRIIKLPRLFSDWDLIPFIQRWNFNAKLSSCSKIWRFSSLKYGKYWSPSPEWPATPNSITVNWGIIPHLTNNAPIGISTLCVNCRIWH